jgi:hypothetical protein
MYRSTSARHNVTAACASRRRFEGDLFGDHRLLPKNGSTPTSSSSARASPFLTAGTATRATFGLRRQTVDEVRAIGGRPAAIRCAAWSTTRSGTAGPANPGHPGHGLGTCVNRFRRALWAFCRADGKRELFHGIPLNTNLCYGNPRLVTCSSRRSWTPPQSMRRSTSSTSAADGTNNQCECPLCRDTRPADFYVAMLNARTTP